MQNTILWAWLQETLARLFKKSPTFFKWWQNISVALLLVSGVPYVLSTLQTTFNFTLPAIVLTLANKAIAFAAAGALFMSKLTVADPNDDKMKFTGKN